MSENNEQDKKYEAVAVPLNEWEIKSFRRVYEFMMEGIKLQIALTLGKENDLYKELLDKTIVLRDGDLEGKERKFNGLDIVVDVLYRYLLLSESLAPYIEEAESEDLTMSEGFKNAAFDLFQVKNIEKACPIIEVAVKTMVKLEETYTLEEVESMRQEIIEINNKYEAKDLSDELLVQEFTMSGLLDYWKESSNKTE